MNVLNCTACQAPITHCNVDSIYKVGRKIEKDVGWRNVVVDDLAFMDTIHNHYQ
jgi:hypothetical protein